VGRISEAWPLAFPALYLCMARSHAPADVVCYRLFGSFLSLSFSRFIHFAREAAGATLAPGFPAPSSCEGHA